MSSPSKVFEWQVQLQVEIVSLFWKWQWPPLPETEAESRKTDPDDARGVVGVGSTKFQANSVCVLTFCKISVKCQKSQINKFDNKLFEVWC